MSHHVTIPPAEHQTRVPIKAWIQGVPVEEAAIGQLANVAKLPFVFRHVAAMPDVHYGIGATVGSVIATRRAIIPAAVGVDIGCGMVAVETDLVASDLPDSLEPVRRAFEQAVPHGTPTKGQRDQGSWGEPPLAILARWDTFLGREYTILVERFPKLASPETAVRQLGTMGGGNHFLELCLDERDHVWVMLHSGSRGLGNRIGQFFIELARQDMRTWFVNLPDQDLAYFPEGTEHFDDYWQAVDFAQRYAQANRQLMLEGALTALQQALGREVVQQAGVINCHHNYVAREHHYGENVLVTRKGAVRARDGELGIIPGSMGAKSFIVRGKGNPEAFESCSHGAGRRMSRNQARKTFTVEDLAAQTSGVECRKDAGVLDEIPQAYKSIDDVMAAQRDLVEIVHTLKQLLCVKG